MYLQMLFLLTLHNRRGSDSCKIQISRQKLQLNIAEKHAAWISRIFLPANALFADAAQ